MAHGFAFLEEGRDKTVPDAVAAIQRAEGDEQKLRLLQEGQNAYRQASELYRAGKLALASRHFLKAARTLGASGSPLQHWANVHLAELAFQTLDYSLADVLARFRRRPISRATPRSPPALWHSMAASPPRGIPFDAEYAFRLAISRAHVAGEHEFAGAACLAAESSLSRGTVLGGT